MSLRRWCVVLLLTVYGIAPSLPARDIEQEWNDLAEELQTLKGGSPADGLAAVQRLFDEELIDKPVLIHAQEVLRTGGQ